MTEAEWLACADPKRMLEFLRRRVTNRKMRLYACAICRLIPSFVESEPDRQSLELTELDVDGHAAEEAFDGRADTWDIRWYRRNGWDAAARAAESYWVDAFWDGEHLSDAGVDVLTDARRRCNRTLAGLLLEIFGNPFRPVTADPNWLTSTAVALARTIYEDRAFDRLPILADALEEAGCDEPAVLTHCRGDGPHVPGCWVTDLVLGNG